MSSFQKLILVLLLVPLALTLIFVDISDFPRVLVPCYSTVLVVLLVEWIRWRNSSGGRDK